MSLESPFTPALVSSLGSTRSAQFVRINTQANAVAVATARRAWTLHGSEIGLPEAAQLIATAPEMLDRLKFAESLSVVTDTIAASPHHGHIAASPLDRIVSLAEASELVLRTVDSLADVEAPKRGEQADDLFVWHLEASNHRDKRNKLFLALEIGAVRDTAGALQRHVESTLYLSTVPHYTTNKVPDKLKLEIRGLLPQSSILGSVGGIQFSDDTNSHTLSGEIARALLSTVSV
jgi:hypothetical protein